MWQRRWAIEKAINTILPLFSWQKTRRSILKHVIITRVTSDDPNAKKDIARGDILLEIYDQAVDTVVDVGPLEGG
jgi:hypothetical protein